MKLLITGVCGFVGSSIAKALLEHIDGLNITGIDNLMRPGAETGRLRLRRLGVNFIHADMRMASDFASLPPADWIIDAAANPSVLAGVGRGGTSRQLFEHNLAALVNVLEYCKEHKAGLLLLSSSRVYSIPALCSIPLREQGCAFALDTSARLPVGLSPNGIGVGFSTEAPISLYGATKLACEVMALEYASAFGFPVWITRCGVLTGAGQFGTPDQGIFAYWVNAHLRRRPLRYIGFNGKGYQARDAFHPSDLGALLMAQMKETRASGRRTYTAGGGLSNTMSLAEVNAWCDDRFGAHRPSADPQPRPFDIPWVAMDNSEAFRDFGWNPRMPLPAILEEIATHAEENPDWLEVSGI